MRNIIAFFILAVALLLGGGLMWFGGFAFSSLNPTMPDKIIFELRAGMGPQLVAEKLTTLGLLTQEAQEKKFTLLGRIMRSWSKLRVGEYEISGSMTPVEVLQTLTSGKSIQYPVTIREGDNIFQIAEIMAEKKLCTKEAFIKRVRNKEFMNSLAVPNPPLPSLEGFLFPDTYFFTKAEPLDEMIRRMVLRAHKAWTKSHDEQASRLGLTRTQVITLASVIEKETGAPEERPMISSVFHNRLKKRMKLQSDPTTIYGKWENYDGNLRKKDLLEFTPFNTYSVAALPLGPIGNPGIESIEAALKPAQSEYLYFVSMNAGTHAFSRTFEEHNQAVKRYQLDRKAREGKSWKDLKKKPEPKISH